MLKKIIENKYIELFLMILIFLNLIAFILQTDKYINDNFTTFFFYFDIFSVFIFSIEYFIRIISAKNIIEIFKPMMIIDLLAILPFYISFMTLNTTFLRSFRLFKIIRILKLSRYTNALNNIKDAFLKRKNELVIALFIFISAVIISSIAIYFCENDTDNETFKSVINSFWFSIVTITTVGYGDTYPQTHLGKICACLMAIFGVGLHGLLIGVISTAFIDVIKNNEVTNE